MINNKEIDLYTIGELAEQLDRQRQTIRKWEKDGIIPPATYRSKSGRRLYTEKQIKAIVDMVNAFELKQGMAIPKEFKEKVREAFAKATAEDERD